jgi:hypothetical protein
MAIGAIAVAVGVIAWPLIHGSAAGHCSFKCRARPSSRPMPRDANDGVTSSRR